MKVYSPTGPLLIFASLLVALLVALALLEGVGYVTEAITEAFTLAGG